MAQLPQSFDPQLMEKLVHWVNKPVGVHAITALASELDTASKSKLKQELLSYWEKATAPIDHRELSNNTVKVSFGHLTHFIAAGAMDEFTRQKRLYDDNFTVGLKHRVDSFATSQPEKLDIASSKDCAVHGWRMGGAPVGDFRRRNGERLLLVFPVVAEFEGGSFSGKTGNISNGGVLVCFNPDSTPQVDIGSHLTLTYVELCKKYSVESQPVRYEVVSINEKDGKIRVGMKLLEADNRSEFDQLIAHLMNEYKRRNRLDVDNTVTALTARCYNLSAIAQLDALMVLSHAQERYHLLVSQGRSLPLQAELQIDRHMIPHLVERTDIGQSRLFLAWADSQQELHVAELTHAYDAGDFDAVLAAWKGATWSKAFVVKAGPLDPQLAELGTSLPCDVAPVVSKLNAPLPVKVARLSQELKKVALLNEVTSVVDAMVSDAQSAKAGKLAHYRLGKAKGQLRQVPFDKKALPEFEGTYRFSNDCRVRRGTKHWLIVNGYADPTRAAISLPLTQHELAVGDEVTIVWGIDGTEISLAAEIVNYDIQRQSTEIKWRDELGLVKTMFKELEMLGAFSPAFSIDLQANMLDAALRNLILSNLPKVSIFAKVKEQAIALTGLTGANYLPPMLNDQNGDVKLDILFSPELVQQLATNYPRRNEVLMICIIDSEDDSEEEAAVSRHLLSEFDDPAQLNKQFLELQKYGQLYVFALDVTEPNPHADDAIINIERKYVSHYSPHKAKKLDDALAFNLSIQLMDISEPFAGLMGSLRF